MNRRGLTNLFLLAIRDCRPLLRLLSPLQARPDMVSVGGARWDSEYAAGKWAFLDSLAEQSHNAAVAAYVAQLKPNARILDVGCGSGALNGQLRPYGYARYLGIDISERAIATAGALADARTGFTAVEGESFSTEERFDAVVFNESLYYFPDPQATVAHYGRFLAPEGIMVISMALSGLRDGLRKLAVWRAIEGELATIDETVVLRTQAAWIIRAALPKRR
jgi:SAM-dependent methyltransferase